MPERASVPTGTAAATPTPKTLPIATSAYDLAEGVAIVGMGCVLPGARDVPTFWNNILTKKDSIIEVPKGRWDTAIFYDPGGRDDRSYTKIGGFVTDDAFDPLVFRIPPRMAEQLDGVQKMTLVAAREAFTDAGLLDAKLRPVKPFDHERTAVILGNAMGGEVQRTNSRRIQWPFVADRLAKTDAFAGLDAGAQEAILARFKDTYLAGLAPITEDTMPGELSNIVSGRVANVFDLLGKNHTVDAACASSFAALDAAVKALVEHEYDLVLTGGADRSMDVDTYVKFCKIGALSRHGSTPFDARADGFVMGEGAAVFLLKRLSDAVRDGDRIHAVIRGVGASSDGKGKGITAPNRRGQVLAVSRSLAAAGIEPGTIQYIEAHGTSTRVGDVVEVEALSEAFAGAGFAPGAVGIGSVKSQIGHLKSGAGAAGLLKTVLAFEHKTLPPSLHFETPNPNVDWASSPFRVVTSPEPWPENRGLPRRAGISSFGFGGTNFHIIVEEYVPEHHARELSASAASPTRPASRGTVPAAPTPAPVVAPAATVPPAATAATPALVPSPEAIRARLERLAALEGAALVVGGATQDDVVAKLRALATGFPTETSFATEGRGARLKDLVHPYNVDGVTAPARVALVAKDLPSVREQAQFALSCLEDPRKLKMAPVRGVFAGTGPGQGKIAFLFPGQGSQYAEMLRDLYEKYAVVRDTFHEADVIMMPLIGRRLTEIVFPAHPADEKARDAALAEAEEALRQTEICQPAVLTADIALWRLLRSYGIEPDMVAGHSLGEYAALVAAGILRFEDALFAVSARGKEMAHVDVPDLGKMASITAPFETVKEVLASCTGYVIPANKNCPAMTVIAGSSTGVDEAVKRFAERGIQAQHIPVSAAFHSEIVAPASGPLRRVLAQLPIRPHRVPVYANVTGWPYKAPKDVPDYREYVLDMLAKQVASPVEWTEIIQHMHRAGVRTFIEIGPKRALSGFVANILENEEHVAVTTNHPKKGGVWQINEAYAILAALGHMPHVHHPEATAHYTPAYLDPLDGLVSAVAASGAVAQVQAPASEVHAPVPADTAPTVGSSDVATPLSAGIAIAQATGDRTLRDLAGQPGFDAYVRDQAPLVGALLEAGWRRDHARYADKAPIPVSSDPASTQVTPAGAPTNDTAPKVPSPAAEDIVVSGCAVGLPGRHRHLFDDSNVDAILDGQNFIDPLDDDVKARMLDKNIVRLTKGSDGAAGFQAIDDVSQVIKLAAQIGSFDIAKEYGIDAEFATTLDVTTKMAIGAAIEALKDAGIPLVRNYVRTSTGSYLPGEWTLPKELQDETGVIFASAFPGYDNLVDEVSRHLAARHAGATRAQINALFDRLVARITDPRLRADLTATVQRELDVLGPADEGSLYTFNRKFLFNVLSMGHAQVAQLLKAKGPNTQVNAACSSTTLAVALAEDWIRAGRCRRVIVVGADDVTSDHLLEWIGAGFLASGAATTEEDVRVAALPFDRRRHGMIIGAGAVGLIVEARSETRARGMDGLVRLLSTQIANSAFHGSRLDVQHIAGQMELLVGMAEDRYGVDRRVLASDLVFMSHETYTPARGGSASAEVESLRRTFGELADHVVVANTKGFTGHPMGAGIEDAIAIKALQLGRVPPIANHREADPELGGIRLSPGGPLDAHYTLRLAAGFGSQIAMWLGESLTKGTDRIVDATRHDAWLRAVSGQAKPVLETANRTLRVKDSGAPSREEAPVVRPRPEPSIDAPKARPPPTPAIVATRAPVPAPTVPHVDATSILEKVVRIVADKTGYPIDMLEPDLDMEADLGIDTVKQAELFGLLRETYELPQEEGMQIKDYPTLRAVAGYISERLAMTTAATVRPTAHPAPTQPPDQARPVARPATTVAPPPMQQTHLDTAPAPAKASAAPQVTSHVDETTILGEVVRLIADKTGYPVEMLEPDLDMEADLGIDTVKQAELFGTLRERYALPPEEGVQIKDYPTIKRVAGYLADRMRTAAERARVGVSPHGEPLTSTSTPPASAPPRAEDRLPAQQTPAKTKVIVRPLEARGATPVRARAALDDLDDGAPRFGTPSTPAQTPTPTPTSRSAAPAPSPSPAPRSTLNDGPPSLATAKLAPSDSAVTIGPKTPPPARPIAAKEAPAPRIAPSPPPTKGTPDANMAEGEIVALIAAKTGYPADMLETGLDMEADLGIDTVKQAEIFGEVRARYGLALPEGLKIADYPTIGHVVAFVIANTDAPAASPATPPARPPMTTQATELAPAQASAPDVASIPAAPSPTLDMPIATAAIASPTGPSPIRRMVPVPVPAPLDGRPQRALNIDGPLLVTQDGLGWAPEFIRALHGEGVRTVLLGRTEPTGDVPGVFVPVDLGDAVAVERTVAAIRQRLGAIGGVLHLASLREDRIPHGEKAFKAATREQVKSLFAVCRAAADDLSRPDATIVTITRMGGTFTLPRGDGRLETDVHFNPFDGGAAGLTKALAKEFPASRARVLDLGQEIGAKDAARLLLTELSHATERVEVGYPHHTERVAVEIRPKPTPRFDTLPIGKTDHLLVSGGAQGVTAACLAALLERLGADAPAITILGRTALPGDIEALARMDETALKARKDALLAALRAGNARVTPVMLNEAWAPTQKAIEVQHHLDRFRELGARVLYLAVDVMDQAAVGSAVAQARAAHGPVTVIVHGAGTEKSKAIRDKDSAQFDLVFDTKVLGLHNLVVATIDDQLKALCVMSSVAGRFGNIGQVDYSAANDLGVRYATALGRARGMRGYGIDWSAWADVGMATRGGIMSVMETAGVTPIPVSIGRSLFVDELLRGDEHPEVVVAGALGALDAEHQVQRTPIPTGPAPRALDRAAGSPLLDGIMAEVPCRRLVATHHVDDARDPYLADHRVDGTPYLPGVFGLEAFAEAALSLLTVEEREAGYRFIGAEDVRFDIPVKVLKGRALDVRVVAERVGEPPAPKDRSVQYEVATDFSDAELIGEPGPPTDEPLRPARFRCRVESDFVNVAGDIVGDVRVHFTADVILGPSPETAQRAPFSLPTSRLYDRADVYDHLFHGPTFQVLDAIDSIDGPTLVARARFEHEGLFSGVPRPRFATAPLAREAAFQAAGFWALAERGRMSLPAGIRRVVHAGQGAEAPPGTTLIVLAQHERDLPDGRHSEYTVETWTPEGVLVDRMEGYRMVTTGAHPIPPRKRGDAAPGPSLVPGGNGSRPAAPAAAKDDDGDWELMVRDDPDVARAATTAVGGHDVLRVDVGRTLVDLDAGRLDDVFTDAERSRLAGMKVAKRRGEHAAGVLAAKQAIRAALSRLGVAAKLPCIEIRPEAGTRRPVWAVPGLGDPPSLHLSITHSGPHAIALAVPESETMGIGVDLERVEARDGAFLDIAFDAEEMDAAETGSRRTGHALAEVVTRFWTVKEAIAKGLGVGLALPLRSIRIEGLHADGRADVRLSGVALERLSALGATRVEVRTSRFDSDHVGAVARLEP